MSGNTAKTYIYYIPFIIETLLSNYYKMSTIYSAKTTPHTRRTRKHTPITFDGKPSPVIPRTPTQVVPPCSDVLTLSFTHSTQQLLKYIESRPILPFRLSKVSKDCLTQIIQMVHHSSVHTPAYTLDNISSNEMTRVMAEFENTRESRSIPSSIWTNISNSEKIGRIVTAQLHGRTIHLYLILPKSVKHSRLFSSAKLAESFFDTCARRIMVWLDIVLPFSGKECASSLDCYLFFTDDIKTIPYEDKSSPGIPRTSLDRRSGVLTLPKKSIEHIQLNDGGGRRGMITPKHANTAFTYSCVPSSQIVLFRMEEWFKVFIHETFHCFGLDFSQMDMTESNKHMSKLFPKCQSNMDFRIYETYCETWAETINLLFIAYLQYSRTKRRSDDVRSFVGELTEDHLGYDKTDRMKHTRRCSSNRGMYGSKVMHTVRPVLGEEPANDCADLPIPKRIQARILKRIEHMIQRERMFSMFQMTKVLHHYSITYADVCSTLEHLPKYTEETQVFAYYIVKPVLLYHLNEFVEWCVRHNGDNTTLFFKKTEGNIREYGDLIERLYMLPDFIKSVNTERTRYSRLSNNIKSTIRDTLRMSLFEMETT